MKTTVIVAFLALWFVLIVLALLVLLLYRQFERTYLGSNQGASLAPGSRLPPVEVATEAGLWVLELPPMSATTYAVVATTKCEDCLRILENLPSLVSRERITLFTAGEWNPRFREAARGYVAYALGHPPDAERALGISGYPTTIAVRDGRVVGSTGDHSHARLAGFVAAAEELNLSEYESADVGPLQTQSIAKQL